MAYNYNSTMYITFALFGTQYESNVMEYNIPLPEPVIRYYALCHTHTHTHTQTHTHIQCGRDIIAG